VAVFALENPVKLRVDLPSVAQGRTSGTTVEGQPITADTNTDAPQAGRPFICIGRRLERVLANPAFAEGDEIRLLGLDGSVCRLDGHVCRRAELLASGLDSLLCLGLHRRERRLTSEHGVLEG